MNEFQAADLPAFQEWSRGFQPHADERAYLGEHLSVTTASLFAELLFPDMVLVRDSVMLASRYQPSNFENWWTSTGGDQSAVERALNRIHLQARRTFPDRRFVVEVTDEYGPTVVLSTEAA
jgi:hypothetical protein